MTDFRALCARMADELDRYRHREAHALATEARAALAQPESEGPSEDDLTQLLFDSFRGPIEFICDAEEEAHLMIRSHVKFARAVLTRWGRPAPPAKGEVGEVAELVAWLRMYGATGRQVLDQTPWTASQLDRAADLLERLAPQPIAVSERLPGPDDLGGFDSNCCWWGHWQDGHWIWIWDYEPVRNETHWLPANTPVLPAGAIRQS